MGRKKLETKKSAFLSIRIEPNKKLYLIKKHGKKLTKIIYNFLDKL